MNLAPISSPTVSTSSHLYHHHHIDSMAERRDAHDLLSHQQRQDYVSMRMQSLSMHPSWTPIFNGDIHTVHTLILDIALVRRSRMLKNRTSASLVTAANPDDTLGDHITSNTGLPQSIVNTGVRYLSFHNAILPSAPADKNNPYDMIRFCHCQHIH